MSVRVSVRVWAIPAVVVLGVALGACAKSSEPGPGYPGWAPVGGISQVTVEGRMLHYADLLGEERLEKGYGGEYEADTRWFRAWLVAGADARLAARSR